MNPYKMGHPEYYGLDLEVDTTRPFTVVTRKQRPNTISILSSSSHSYMLTLPQRRYLVAGVETGCSRTVVYSSPHPNEPSSSVA